MENTAPRIVIEIIIPVVVATSRGHAIRLTRATHAYIYTLNSTAVIFSHNVDQFDSFFPPYLLLSPPFSFFFLKITLVNFNRLDDVTFYIALVSFHSLPFLMALGEFFFPLFCIDVDNARGSTR